MNEERFYNLMDIIARETEVESDSIFYEDFLPSDQPKWIKVKTPTGFNCYPVVNADKSAKFQDLHNDARRKTHKYIRAATEYGLALYGYSILNGDHLEHQAQVDELKNIANERISANSVLFYLSAFDLEPMLYRARISASRFMSFLPSGCEPVNDIETFFQVAKTTNVNGVKKRVFNIPNVEQQVFYFNQRGLSRKQALAAISRNYTRFEVDTKTLIQNAMQFSITERN